jgi:hypothetical protein
VDAQPTIDHHLLCCSAASMSVYFIIPPVVVYALTSLRFIASSRTLAELYFTSARAFHSRTPSLLRVLGVTRMTLIMIGILVPLTTILVSDRLHEFATLGTARALFLATTTGLISNIFALRAFAGLVRAVEHVSPVPTPR